LKISNISENNIVLVVELAKVLRYSSD